MTAIAAVGMGLAMLFLASPSAAQGQTATVQVLGNDDRAPAFEAQVRQACEAAGYELIEPVEHALETTGLPRSIREARVLAFDEVQSLVVAARRERAALREGEALSLLTRARALARDHADVPGSAGWLAEIEIAFGVASAQAGLAALSRNALERAATLDRSRRLRAAEAPPGLVARANAIANGVATRPEGTFEIRVSADEARAFLNDELIGVTPVTVQAPVGSHVLRIEAPGHLPYGRVIEVREGRRRDVQVSLSPGARLLEARALVEEARRFDLSTLPERITSAGVDMVVLLEVGTGLQNRAIVVACTPAGCADAVRLEDMGDSGPLAEQLSGPELLAGAAALRALPSHRDWLLEPPPVVVVPTAWYERWYTWAGIAAVATAGAIVAIAFATRPEPEQGLQLRVFGPPAPDGLLE